MSENLSQKAWIVFTGQTDLKHLVFLKKGFRHCFVVMQDGPQWITIDPLASHIELKTHDVTRVLNLPKWLEQEGHVVIEAQMKRQAQLAPLQIMSCVEVAKRIIGVRNRFILTPYQLYRHLACQNSKITSPKPKLFSKGVLKWEA